MRCQSVSSRRAARAHGRPRWPPAAHSGPSAPPSDSARSSAARPRRISSRSQRARSCSSSSTGRPDASTRAAVREACSSISATRPCTSGSLRREFGQHAAQAQRLVAQRRAHPVLARGRRVALVEDQVDDLQHRGQPLAPASSPRGTSKGTLGLAERALGAHDALRDRRLGHQVGAGDLVRRQAAQQLQRERDARFGGQHRMAGGEDQAQQVVADLVGAGRVERVDEVRHDQRLLRLEVVADLLQLALAAPCRGAAGRARGSWRWP